MPTIKTIYRTTLLCVSIGLFFLFINKLMSEEKVIQDKAPIILRLAEPMSKEHPSAKAIEYFGTLVEEQSEGRILIKVYEEGALGTPEEVLEQLQFGGIALARVNVIDLIDVVPSLKAYFKPGEAKNADELMEWIQQNESKLADDCQMERLIPIGFYRPDLRCFYSDEIQMTDVADLENKKIKIPSSSVMESVMQSVGATGVTTITADTYKSLRTGYMQLGESTLGEFVLSDFYSFMQYITVSKYMQAPDVIVLSLVEGSALAVQDKQLLVDCLRQTYAYQKEELEAFQQKWLKELEHSKELFYDETFDAALKEVLLTEKRSVQEKGRISQKEGTAHE